VRAKNIRRAAVAGMFYPEDAQELHRLVQEYLGAAHLVAPPPKAVIAPHAGYVYSGPVAGLRLPAASAAEGTRAPHNHGRTIPPGSVPRHRGPQHRLLRHAPRHRAGRPGRRGQPRDLPGVVTMDAAHAEEHSLEVHLPFLQEVLEEFSIVPLVVGDASRARGRRRAGTAVGRARNAAGRSAPISATTTTTTRPARWTRPPPGPSRPCGPRTSCRSTRADGCPSWACWKWPGRTASRPAPSTCAARAIPRARGTKWSGYGAYAFA
jgi:hypothetical protein